MSRQILQLEAQFEKFTDSRLTHIEAGDVELRFERVGLVFVFEMPDETRQTVERLGIETQRLAHFSRRRPAAIGYDIGRHRSAQRAVSLVDILNRALALIAAGQVEVDVGPFASLFGEK